MDLEEDSLVFTRKLLVLISSGFATYKFIRLLTFVPNMVALSSEIITIFSKDFKHLFTSDSDQIPISLKQLSKICRSEILLDHLTDFTDEISFQFMIRFVKTYQALTETQQVGFLGYVSRTLDKLFSTVGSGFFSVIVANFAKKLATGNELTVPSNGKFKKVVQHCIMVFLSSPLYTNNANACNHIFSVFTNPAHQEKLIDMLVSVSRRTVDTLAAEASNEQASPKKLRLSSGGVVTFETTRCGVEFLMWKLMEGLKMSLDVVDEDEAVCRGLELIRYFIAKSSVFFAIFIALYLHVVGGIRLLSPATTLEYKV